MRASRRRWKAKWRGKRASVLAILCKASPSQFRTVAPTVSGATNLRGHRLSRDTRNSPSAPFASTVRVPIFSTRRTLRTRSATVGGCAGMTILRPPRPRRRTNRHSAGIRQSLERREDGYCNYGLEFNYFVIKIGNYVPHLSFVYDTKWHLGPNDAHTHTAQRGQRLGGVAPVVWAPGLERASAHIPRTFSKQAR